MACTCGFQTYPKPTILRCNECEHLLVLGKILFEHGEDIRQVLHQSFLNGNMVAGNIVGKLTSIPLKGK